MIAGRFLLEKKDRIQNQNCKYENSGEGKNKTGKRPSLNEADMFADIHTYNKENGSYNNTNNVYRVHIGGSRCFRFTLFFIT